MIPSRAQIQAKINDYYTPPLPQQSLEHYISDWLDTQDLPETVVIASQEVDPKQQILDDLDSYAQQPA